MPGFSPKPPLTHRAQIIQPPCLAWVDANCTDDDIIFGRKRKWKEPLSEGAIPLTTNQMHRVLMKDRRMVDISAHYKHLVAKEQLAKECAQNYVVKNPSNPDDKAPPEIEYHESTTSFMNLVEKASQQFHCADMFEQDMVKNVNPKAGSVDQMFAWGITPHCETSHDGMKKVYAEIAESFRLVQSDEGQYWYCCR